MVSPLDHDEFTNQLLWKARFTKQLHKFFGNLFPVSIANLRYSTTKKIVALVDNPIDRLKD